MRKLLIAVLLSALCVFGADFSGRWSGTAEATRDDGSTNTDPVHFNLKQDGTTITGTAGGPNDDFSITDGKVEGNSITFTLAPEGRGVFKVKLTIDGENMTGDVSREGDGDKKLAKLSLKREK